MSKYYNPNAYLSKIKDRDWPVLYQFVEFGLFFIHRESKVDSDLQQKHEHHRVLLQYHLSY